MNLLGFGLIVVVFWATTTPVLAIPAFARKYGTSCQTCHIAFPALTPFGEAFRLNGYRFPEGADMSMTKQEPISLGSEGYKKLWPKSVWPGDIPGLPPISVVVESEVANSREDKTTTFNDLGGEFALLTGGTLGDNVSFYGEVEAVREDGESSVEMQRLLTLFHPLHTPVFQIKVGAFEPGLMLVSSHRRLTDAPYFATTQPVGDNEWTAEEYQQGIEFFGVAGHRLLYNAGYVEGRGNASNNAKDVYGRVAYKFGGMRLDGTMKEGAAGATANPKPWSEKSVTVSAFVYKGSPLLSRTDTMLVNDPNTNIVTPVETTLEQSDRFTYYGGDVQWNFLNLIFHAGAMQRTDRRPFLDDPSFTDATSKNRFVELDWVAYPWLIPATRWESLDVEGAKLEKLSLTFQFLLRANVRSFLAADRVKEPGGSYKTDEVVAGLVFGM